MSDRGEDDPLDERVDEVIAEYLASEDAGEALPPQVWIDRHPEIAPQLREFFATHRRIHRLVERSGSAPPGLRPTERIEPAGFDPMLSATTPCAPRTADTGRLPRPFGPYLLLECLGRGGQGVVYRARQDGLNREVALKTILWGTDATADEVRRFRDEAEAVAELGHPNIVPVHEVGQHEGCWYFTMGLMKGGSLDRRLDEFQRDPRSAARVMIDVAAAVQHAHARGILHRDLKPSNVLFDAGGRAHVSDFGLAKRFGRDTGADTKTASGALAGTPSYMAPEQAEGRKAAVTTTTDVYGLGAILYTMLRGQPPFRGDSALEVLEQVKSREPEPLRSGDLRVDRDLETICLTCLRKEPQRRYASPDGLADDLGRWLEGRPIQARRVSAPERLMLWARRRPAVASLLVAVAAVTAAGLTVAAWQWDQAVRLNEQLTRSLDSLKITTYFQSIALAERAWKFKSHGEAVRLLEGCPRELRGWEWSYLVGLRDEPPVTIQAHPGSDAYAAVFSPHGERLATGGGDGVVRLWDLQTGAPLREFKGHTGRVRGLAFDPTGRILATASWDGSVRVWDAETGKTRREFLGSQAYRKISVSFSREGGRLAACGSDGTIRVWDTRTWDESLSIETGQGALLRVEFSPDGRLLASAGDDGTARVWDAATGKSVAVLGDPGDTVYGLAFWPQPDDSPRLAVARGDGSVQVWDIRARRRLFRTAAGHDDSARGVAVHPDGSRLASAGGDGSVVLWDARSGQEALLLRRNERGLTTRSVSFSPDGTRLAASLSDGSVVVWRAPRPPSARWSPRRSIEGHDGVVFGVALRCDGEILFTAGGDHTLRAWDPRTGVELPGSPLWRSDSQVLAAACSPDGRFLAAVDGHGRVSLWDARSFRQLDQAELNRAGLWSVAFSRDARRLAAGGALSDIHVGDVNDGKLGPFRPYETDSGEVWALVFTRDNSHLLSAGSDGVVRSWDLRDANAGSARELRRRGAEDYALALSPDGRTVASAGLDRKVRLMDVETGEPGPTRELDDRVDAVAYSPDGRFLVAACGDATLKVLDPTHLNVLRTLYGHTSRVLSLAFGSDGRFLVSSGLDRTVKVWETAEWPTEFSAR